MLAPVGTQGHSTVVVFGSSSAGYIRRQRKENRMKGTLLWLIAAILVIVGIVQLIQGQILFGIILIIAGCLVGPGGYSVFSRST